MPFLPDTSLTVLAVAEEVYTYAQAESGAIHEFSGELEGPTQVYSFRESRSVTLRYGGDDVETAGAPKFFTPLAAAYIGLQTTKRLFYVDDNNIIRSRTSKNGGKWLNADILPSNLVVKCAHYSQLTALSISKNGFEGICLYYQTPKKSGVIDMLGYSTKNNIWVHGPPDLTPRPPPPPPRTAIIDPPLYGTSMTAVPARPALRVIKNKNSEMPVVYLQWDDLALAHSQEDQIKPIPSLDAKFAPHTSLSAIDDGENLYCFYTSTHNNNIKMTVIKDNEALDPVDVATPTPKSSIAAAITNNRIILFYQSLNKVLGKVQLKCMTFSKTPGLTPWPVASAQRATITIDF